MSHTPLAEEDELGLGFLVYLASRWLLNAKHTGTNWIGEIKSNRIVFYEEKSIV